MSTMEQAIDYVLNYAGKKKLHVDVLATEKSSTRVDMQARKVEQFSFSESHELGVRVVSGHNEGIAYSESLDAESLDEMISEATANSRMIKKEIASELHPAAKLPTMDFLFNSSLQNIGAEQKIAAATALEAAAWDFDKRIVNVPRCSYRDVWMRHWVANSNGLKSQFQANGCSGYVGCMAKDGEAPVNVNEGFFARDFNLLKPEKIAQLAAKKTIDRLGARRPATGRYTVIFENRVAEQLVEMLSAYFSAKAIDEKSSPLAGKLGQALFSKVITLADDPFYTKGTSSRPFDDEGYASKKTMLIEQGKVVNFLTNTVFAKKLKIPHTAHGSRSPSTDLDISPSNLIVEPGTKKFDQLLNADPKVIVITNILGAAGFREVSGDFSLPVEGHLYQNGKPVHALKDFLISGNLLQVFASIEAVGDDVLPPVSGTICPSLLIRDLNVAGQS